LKAAADVREILCHKAVYRRSV